MAKFWNKLAESRQSLNTEIETIEELLDTDGGDSVGFDGSFSVSLGFDGAVNNLLQQNFLSWPHRRNFVALEQLRNDLGITDIVHKATRTDEIREARVAKLQADDHNERKKDLPRSAYDDIVNCNLDEYLEYAEFVLNILPLAYRGEHDWNRYDFAYADVINHGHTYNGVLPGMTKTILNNIRNTVAGLGHKIIKIESEDAYRIVPNDAIVHEAAAKQSELADDLMLYMHHATTGDLKNKKAILNRLNIAFESKWKKVLSNRGHATLVSDIGYLVNNLKIKHGEISAEAKVIEQFTDAEKEKWHDKLFKLYIAAYEIGEAAGIQSEVDVLKKEVQARIKRP